MPKPGLQIVAMAKKEKCVWHFPFPSVEESKTTVGRMSRRNRHMNESSYPAPFGLPQSQPQRKAAVYEQDSTEVP